MSKTVLLTGATGLIGGRLAKQLVTRGHRLICVTRRVRDFDFACEPFLWDLTEPQPAKALPKVDVVAHLAGETVAQRWTSAAKKRILESRTIGTHNLVEALGEQKPHLVSASAIGYYGDTEDRFVDEESPCGTGFLAEVCSKWESEALRLKDKGGRVSILRIGIVLASEGGALSKMKRPFSLGLGLAIGSGKQYMSWIHIDDLIDMWIEQIESEDAPEIINGVGPKPETNHEFSNSLARSLGRSLLPNVPGFLLKLSLGEMSEIILGSQRVRSKYSRDFRFEQLDGAFADILSKGGK